MLLHAGSSKLGALMSFVVCRKAVSHISNIHNADENAIHPLSTQLAPGHEGIEC